LQFVLRFELVPPYTKKKRERIEKREWLKEKLANSKMHKKHKMLNVLCQFCALGVGVVLGSWSFPRAAALLKSLHFKVH